MTFYDLLQQLQSVGDFDGYIYPGISDSYELHFRWDRRWVLGRRWYLAYSRLMRSNAAMFPAHIMPVLGLSLRSADGSDQLEINRDNLPAVIKASIDGNPAVLQDSNCGIGGSVHAVRARGAAGTQYFPVNSMQLDNGALTIIEAQIDSDNTQWFYESFPPAIYLNPSDFAVSFIRELESFVRDIKYATKEFDGSDTDPAELFL
jgi:hypothetical protein